MDIVSLQPIHCLLLPSQEPVALRHSLLPWPHNHLISVKNAGHRFPSVLKAKAESYKPKGCYSCSRLFRAVVTSGLCLNEVVFLNLAAGMVIAFLGT